MLQTMYQKYSHHLDISVLKLLHDLKSLKMDSMGELELQLNNLEEIEG